MKTISPPGELLAEVARELLGHAEKLGHQASVVETTTGAEFGYGFVVPDDVFEAWFTSRGEARAMATAELPTESGGTEDLELQEPEATPEPVAEPEVPAAKPKRGPKAATDRKED